MAILKTEVIVLRTRKWSETSSIVSVYSRDFGKFNAIAKGARRPKSKFGNCLSPVTQSQILFYARDPGKLHILKEVSVINYFPNLKSDVEKFAYASAICEVTEYLTAESEKSSSVYYALCQTLNKMEGSPLDEFKKLFWHFELRLFAIAGYAPQLSRCVCCGVSSDHLLTNFSLSLGGLLCQNCRYKDSATRKIHLGTIKFLRMLQKISIAKVGNLKSNPFLEKECETLLEDFRRYHTEDYRRLKSLQVLHQIE